MHSLAVLVVCLGVSVVYTGALQASDYFKLCNYEKSGFDECVKESIIAARPHIVDGIPELGFPPHEPLFVKEVGYEQGEGRLFFKQIFRKLHFHGMGDYKVNVFKSDFRNLTTLEWRLKVTFPLVKWITDYVTDGYILVFPVQGTGDGNFNMTEFSWDMTFKGRVITKDDGKRYFDLQKILVLWDVKKAKILFNNLFNGNKFLGQTANRFLNDNFKLAFQTLKHLPEKSFGEIFRDNIRPIFDKFTFDELFLA